ncbi:MAG TPA: hypothetical protein VK071_02840 [Tissierellales bacterium]|nr:hypothetical protein [Tissierellales bacterium]
MHWHNELKILLVLEEQIRHLGMLPCRYHKYYYLQDDMFKSATEDYKKHGTRAKVVKKVEKELFELYTILI